MNTTTRTHGLIATLAVFVAAMLGAGTAAAAEVDLTKWKCERCPFPQGMTGDVAVGARVVSDAENRFGNYTGYDDDTVYGGFGVQNFRYWGDHGYSAYVDGFGYSQDSFELTFGAGHQGRWSADFLVDFLPVRKGENTRSVYDNLDGTPQGLPDDWIRGGGTGGMTTLDSNLRGFDIEWDRETFGFGGEFLFTPNLVLDADWRYQTKEGKGVTWGTFLSNATQLTEPLDYDTHEVDLGVTYGGDNWKVRGGYYGSWFSNKNLAHTWDNAFIGPDRGRMAGAPDNKAYNVNLAATYTFRQHTTASANLSTGEAEQDDDFLPYTINPDIPTSPLPRTSYDGKVDTTHVDLRVTSAPWKRVRITGEYRYDDRDNDSSREVYDWVSADLVPGGAPQENFLYSYTRKDFDLFSDFRIRRGLKTTVGFTRNTIERQEQEVDENEEDIYWAKLKFNVGVFELDLRGENGERDVDGDYEQVDFLKLSQNPLMRKYNMADRDRKGFKARAAGNPSDRLNIALTVESWSDDYDNSEVGLTDGDRDLYVLDANFALRDNINLYGSFGKEEIQSKQSGAQSNVNPNTAQPNWQGRNDDDFDTASLGMRWSGIGRWGLELDYVYAKSEGKTEIRQSFGNDQFPKFETELNRASLGVTYDYSQRMRFVAGVLYEDYDSDDWGVDGVAPDTISNVLTWGGASPDYEVTLFSVGFRYNLGDPERRDQILYALPE
jgi:MtrB/PioB family decaheme-associated outer membrane protein